MSRVIAVVNQKGGVAKTTTVVHLGAALAAMGRRVLLVDLDPQGSLTLCSGFEPDALERTVYDGMIRDVPGDALLLHTAFGADLLPANIDLSEAEIRLVTVVAREHRLAQVLVNLRDRYDYLLIDCQPSLGLLTQNALAVADEVLVPLACEYLALRSLRVLVRALGRVRLQLNSRLKLLGVLPTFYDPRTAHSRRILEELRGAFSGRVPVLPVVIPRSVRYLEAAAGHLPVTARKSPTAVVREAPTVEAYQQVAQLIDQARAAAPAGQARPSGLMGTGKAFGREVTG